MTVSTNAVNNQIGTSTTTTVLAHIRSAAGQWDSYNDQVDTFGFYNSAGTPNAVVTANFGSIATDTTGGHLYVKQADATNTSWVQLAEGTALTWIEATADVSPMVANRGYIANKAGTPCAFTLPAVAAVGDRFAIVGQGATGWSLTAAAGDVMHVGSSDSSAGGSVTFTNRYDGIEIICTVANSEFVMRSLVGNPNVA